MFELGVVAILIIALAFVLFRSLWRDLDFTSGESICLSLGILYYFLGRSILWHGFLARPGSPPVYWGTGPAFLLGIASVWIAYLRRRHIQQSRDTRAMSALTESHAGGKGRYFLYLRSFAITDKVPVDQDSLSESQRAFATTFYGPSKTRDFEDILTEAIEPLGHFIALGEPGETFGASRILSDNEEAVWHAKVLDLMRDAGLIFLVPSAHAGTLWEIEQILKLGYLRKTIWILPPNTTVNQWQATCERLRRPDLRLEPWYPHHAKRERLGWFDRMTSGSICLQGRFFTLNEQRCCEGVANIPQKMNPTTVFAAIKDCLSTSRREDLLATTSETHHNESKAVTPPNEIVSHNVPLSLVNCEHCGVRVFLKADGQCPSCRKTNATKLKER